MFVLASFAGKRNYSYRHGTFSTDGQWLLNRAIKCARWQHRAVRSGTRIAVPDPA